VLAILGRRIVLTNPFQSVCTLINSYMPTEHTLEHHFRLLHAEFHLQARHVVAYFTAAMSRAQGLEHGGTYGEHSVSQLDPLVRDIEWCEGIVGACARGVRGNGLPGFASCEHCSGALPMWALVAPFKIQVDNRELVPFLNLYAQTIPAVLKKHPKPFNKEIIDMASNICDMFGVLVQRNFVVPIPALTNMCIQLVKGGADIEATHKSVVDAVKVAFDDGKFTEALEKERRRRSRWSPAREAWMSKVVTAPVRTRSSLL